MNYFGKSWPIAFWNSDLSEVSVDFRTIQEDGFNAIILIVPWGEFQPGVDPIHFNDDAYRRLSMVCSKAHSAGLKVFLRVSYNADYYPYVQQPYFERANSLITGNSPAMSLHKPFVAHGKDLGNAGQDSARPEHCRAAWRDNHAREPG